MALATGTEAEPEPSEPLFQEPKAKRDHQNRNRRRIGTAGAAVQIPF